MQIVVERAGRRGEASLHLEDPHASVGDLVRAVDPAAGTGAGLSIDGQWFPPEAGLDEIGLHEGALVRIGGQPADDGGSMPVGLVLAVVGGPAAGARLALDGRAVTVGRGEDSDLRLDDPTVSHHHLRIEPAAGGVTVCDLGSHNGTWHDGAALMEPTTVAPGALLRLGASYLRLRHDSDTDRPVAVNPLHNASGGLVPFNRKPRPALPPAPAELVAPVEPEPSTKGRALSAISIIAPIILGTALVIIYQNPRFALFLLLSPVIAIGNWASGRRQSKKENRTSTKAFAEALERLHADLAAVCTEEVRRREVLLPDVAEMLRRGLQPSSQLWQRRPVHDDFLRLHAGIGAVPWDPPVVAGAHARTLDEPVEAVVADYRVLQRCPVQVDLSGGGVVGLVGERTAALALARSLLCHAAVHHGPADVGVAVLCAEDRTGDWDWAKWLPHTRDASGDTRMLAGDPATAGALLSALLSAAASGDQGRARLRRDDTPSGRTVLFVLDDVALTRGRRAPARRALSGEAGPAAGIVIAETEDQLPAVVTTVVELRSDLGDAQLRRPQEALSVDDLVIDGVAEPVARDLARTLARYEDPELEVVGAGVPPSVRLLPVLDMDDLDAQVVAAAWKEGLPDPGPNTPIGVGENGVVHLDLRTDGPHGLIGGTTGSGKSELLRSLVAGMAARVDPEHLNFVLVDYKGGSAFDACARLPHTVGMVTDLDEHLGERALASLEAELHHRERLLRDAGCQDLPEYLRTGAPRGPLPRLVVVVDEFATLATELPDFLGALVGIAQRGRSLGVHMILATQRPSGAVNANIKANTNLRIALRMQDVADSTDVIDRKDAAEIPRSIPGRAYVRLGPGEVILVQTALSTAAASAQAAPVRLGSFPFAPRPPVPPTPPGPDGEAATDLERLVAAAGEAFTAAGMPPPREPWLPMLAEHIALDDVLARAGADVPVPVGIADEPKHQRQQPTGWDPREGHLGVFGMVGSGTTTALVTVVLALAQRYSPDDCHVYAVDYGAGGLAALAGLPHVGAIVGANDAQSRAQLVRLLRREVDRRRDLDGQTLRDEPLLVVVVDGIAALLAEYDSAEALEAGEALKRAFADGPTVRIVFVVAGDRVGELPARMGSLVARKLLLRHADPQELTGVGLRSRSLPVFVPGRAVDAGSHLVVQLAHPGTDVRERAAALAAAATPARPPQPIRTLPARLALADLPGTPSGGTPLVVPLGVDDQLASAALRLYPTDHAVVLGPPRSGKTTTLALIAHQVRRAEPDARIVAVCPEHSPLYGLECLDAAGELGDLLTVVRASMKDSRRWVFLVDDAPHVADVDDALGGLLGARKARTHVVAATRTDEVRVGLAHWSRAVRQSRAGVLLQPNLATDGELLSVALPRRGAGPLGTPGRGFGGGPGTATLAQLAEPPQYPATPADDPGAAHGR